MKENKPHTRYFRISVTDNCNLNCYFCHKEGQSKISKDYLSTNDFIWAAGIAVDLGFTKFKITGGEPTLRNDIPQIVKGIKDKGAKDISLITNGIRLSEFSPKLHYAGLDRINVSVYSFDANTFEQNCNGSLQNLDNIINGIDDAIKTGFKDIKLNFILNNINRINDLNKILEFAKNRNLRVLLLPLLNYNIKSDDIIYSFSELYKFVKSFGIKHEEIITDNEGFRQRLILTESGAKILLRLDYLSDLNIFNACANCQHKDECLEGILPLRLSSKGTLLPCLAKGIPEIDVRSIIAKRDKLEFKNIIKNIAEL